MACRVEVTLEPGDEDAIDAASEALDEADRVEALLTVFRESSELSRINREAAGGCDAVEPAVFDLLERCARLSADTSDAFDITSTPLSRCWGFLARDGRVPADAEIERARTCVGIAKLILDRDRHAVRFAANGMEVNLNAVGKGYAIDRMASVLRRRGVGRALVSAGGSSIAAIGAPRGDWRVDVKSPVLGSTVARLRLRDGALGTSGAGEQFVVENGTRYGHVIDPRSGWPARGVISATVIARDGATADALSTAFLVGGLSLADEYCRSHSETLALLCADDGPEPLRVYGGYTGARLEH